MEVSLRPIDSPIGREEVILMSTMSARLKLALLGLAAAVSAGLLGVWSWGP